MREWLSLYYKGRRSGQSWTDLWGVAESIDLTLEMAHRQGGFGAVVNALGADDRLEHWLRRLGSEVSYQVTGSEELRQQLQSSHAPGEGHAIPDWAISAARDTTKAIFQEKGRSRFSGGVSSDDERAPRRRPRKRPGRGRGSEQPSQAAPPRGGGKG